ncbi:MAG: SiaB family protein kinase [Bacteroidota bacterium]
MAYMLDIFEFYNQMERNKIMLSFKGDITSELLTSILQIMENKLENIQEEPKIKKKVYNVLVEFLKNLYHHLDAKPSSEESETSKRTAIFMIGKTGSEYTIITGNYMFSRHVENLKNKLDKINGMSKEELKEYYKEILNNDEFSSKGGGGLGMIDIARKSGQKLNYQFVPIDSEYTFFCLNIKIA